jgi:hypothetical protein
MNRIIVLVLGVILLAGCSHYLIQDREYENLTSNRTMIIAVLEDSGSPFKQALIDSLTNHYGNRFDIRVVNLERGKELGDQSYDILVIMERVKAWMVFNDNLKDLMRVSDPKKTVIFLSSDDKPYQWQNKRFTAVTSATKKGNVAKTFSRLQAQIDAKLANP